MWKNLIFYTVFPILSISCNKTVENISVNYLTDAQIKNSNFFKKNVENLINAEIESRYFTIVNAQPKKFHFGSLSAPSYPIPLSKFAEIERPKIEPLIRKKKMNEHQYGSAYQFIYTNHNNEPIEEVKITTTIHYQFSNKKIMFTKNKTIKKILGNNETIKIMDTIFYNTYEVFDPIYFETYKPKDVYLGIRTITTNSVGYNKQEDFIKNLPSS